MRKHQIGQHSKFDLFLFARQSQNILMRIFVGPLISHQLVADDAAAAVTSY